MLRHVGMALVVAHVLACATESTPETDPETAIAQGVFGMAPPAEGGVPSVIALQPTGGTMPELREDSAEAVIEQFGLVFSPTELLVPAGSTVRFLNSESLAHNIQLRPTGSDSVVFDADTDPNESASFTFDNAGGYDVSCNLHPGMRAFVFATTSSFATIAEPDGTFRLRDVPPGTYKLFVWHPDEESRSEQEIVVQGDATEVIVSPGN